MSVTALAASASAYTCVTVYASHLCVLVPVVSLDCICVLLCLVISCHLITHTRGIVECSRSCACDPLIYVGVCSV